MRNYVVFYYYVEIYCKYNKDMYNELKYNSQNLFKKANNGLVSDFLNQSCKFIPSPTNIKQRESSVDWIVAEMAC